MTDETEEAIEEFLQSARTALSEYDKGYADADATVRVLRSHIDDLEERVRADR